MFEMSPFWDCPACGKTEAYGVLSVGDSFYTRRCKICQHKEQLYLPEIDKKVIYVDQFVISNMFLHANDPSKESPHKGFWIDLHNQIYRNVLLQAAIFPNSNIHMDESLVSRNYEGLRDTYRSISGDVSFCNTDDIEKRVIVDFAESWIAGNGIPEISYSVDDVLIDKRNKWLPKLRIEANTDFSHFVDDIRSSRQSTSTELAKLFKKWGNEKPSFKEIVENESALYGQIYNQQRAEIIQRLIDEINGGEGLSLGHILGQANVLSSILKRVFMSHGIDEQACLKKITEFFYWDGLEQIPYNRISAYMFAALARKAAAGQKRPPNGGMLNDIRVISSFVPYVDAMLIDNECAALLSEAPLSTDLKYDAKIFCMNSKEDFLRYLVSIEESVSAEVRKAANEVYGLDSRPESGLE